MIHILDFDIDESSLKLSYHKMMAKRIFKFIKRDFEFAFNLLRNDLVYKVYATFPYSLEAFSKYSLMNFQHLYSKILGYSSWSDLVHHCQGLF